MEEKLVQPVSAGEKFKQQRKNMKKGKKQLKERKYHNVEIH